MAVCCKYREKDGGTAIACYEKRDACPDLPNLKRVEEKQVDTCPKKASDCFGDADPEDIRVLQ